MLVSLWPCSKELRRVNSLFTFGEVDMVCGHSVGDYVAIPPGTRARSQLPTALSTTEGLIGGHGVFTPVRRLGYDWCTAGVHTILRDRESSGMYHSRGRTASGFPSGPTAPQEIPRQRGPSGGPRLGPRKSLTFPPRLIRITLYTI